MNTLNRYIFALALLILFTMSLVAQGPKLPFKNITSEQGLSNNTIESIFQDSRGFIWLGTRDGLNRYDGDQIVVYRYDAANPRSISDNYIRFIYEDRHHNLWIATRNGLNRFNPAQNNFTRYKYQPDKSTSLSHNMVTCIYEDRGGNLWMSTYGGGINLYRPEENIFIHFRHHTQQPNSLSDDRVNYLYEDAKGNFWVATDKGLELFDRKQGKFILYPNLVMDKSTYPQQVINSIQEDGSGRLWLGSQDNGLFLFDPVQKTFLQYRHLETTPSSLGSNQVRSVLIDRKGNLWVGGVNAGLNLWNPATQSFFHYQNDPDNTFSLSQRTVSAIFEDRQGNLWVGTHRGGVNLYTPGTEKFTLFRQTPIGNSISYNDVKAFCEDSKGQIWIGTDGGGLNVFDRHKRSFGHYRYNPYDPTSLSSDEVLHVAEDSEGNLWIGTWGGGLNLMNRQTGTFTHFKNDPYNSRSISSNYVQKIFEDHEHNLWIATYYGGLNLFDRKTRTFRRVMEDAEGKTRLYGNNVVSIDEDRSGNIWIGTDDGGLNCYNLQTKRFTHYFDNEEKLPDLRVIFADSKGRLWVGQAGLYLFDPKRNNFFLYTDKAGLATEFIKGITEDQQGNFWISTSNGLTQFHPDTKSYRKYNTSDGLQGLEFEANAYLKTRDGQMYFGGVNGFNSFYLKDIKINHFIPPVYLTDFQVFNNKVIPGSKNSPLAHDISVTKKIVLSYKQSTISFGFAALNFTASENNQYAYMLEGVDKEWNHVGHERKASYHNLRPGEYVFLVKAANNDGIWNTKPTSVQLVITPPFWDTWWFKSLLFLLLGSVAVAFFQFKRRIALQKLEEQKREEMHQMQLQFFTNISHDLRTPLSLIIGPLEKLQKEDSRPLFAHYYKVMQLNANRLLSLMNELMEFRKVESGALQLKVASGNLHTFLEEIAEEFSEVAVQKQMQLQLHLPHRTSELWFDRQILEKIMLNLVSNSFKYTPEGGSITIEAFSSFESFKPCFQNELVYKNKYRGHQYVYIRVADSGIGISKESISHLFERYYKISESHLGSGVGLAFVKSLALLHKGDIYVYSERNKGTEIIIGLPVSKEDYVEAEMWMEHNAEPNVRRKSIQKESKAQQPPLSEKNILPVELVKPSPAEAYHILVVEDNSELRKFLNDVLSPDYFVTEAGDGLEGLNKAKEVIPDLIISDIMMPRMNGIEFCTKVKQDVETCHIPFVMLTAKDAIESKMDGIGSGADHYFSKPLSIDLLLLTIRNIFEQRQKLKERYISDHYVQAKELVHSAKDRELMDQLLSIIDGNLMNPDMDVDYICTRMGMSRTSLNQKVKTIVGQSINEFVRTIRLRKAVEIMTHEDVLLTEVMYRVGIQTQSYFTKAFKKEFDKTPSQFLQELKK